ncbi:hypothetical protein LUZ60_017470 [Juncus effusus]|nr:hypothetical protein LUZ60_017470 [Juncus effusus]
MKLLTKNFSPILTILLLISFALFLSKYFINSNISIFPQNLNPSSINSSEIVKFGPTQPPIFAYFISGTTKENQKIIRLLKSIYHPRNYYLVSLDADSTEEERIELAKYVRNENTFRKFENVFVSGKGNAVDRTGPSIISETLHGAAILLRICENWDWFINLSSFDYPIVTQDDLLDAFMSVPRDLNFIDHTSDLGWKESARFDKIIVDPSLYNNKNSKYFLATESRKTPDAFKLFTGSPWVILSKSFLHHTILGSENLPRKLLMYFANTAYSSESYFQTLACNSPQLQNRTINSDLRFFLWADPPGLDPLLLNQSHFEKIISSGAGFARRFGDNEEVLDRLDKEVLKRNLEGFEGRLGNFTYGKWRESGDVNEVEAGPGGKRLGKRIIEAVVKRKGCL